MKIRTRVIFSLILLYFISNLLHAFSAPASNGASYLLSCGTETEEADTDGRKWQPDAKYLKSSDNTATIQAKFQDPSLPSTVPYMNARIFTSETAYSFPLSKKTRYWLRLSFYPTDYDEFLSKDAYFTVTAGGNTLLKNFNSSVTALALTQAYVMKEYSLNPNSDDLTVTFTPSPDYKGSYAFVNGIEVIPVPDLFDKAKLVGFGDVEDTMVETKASVLQTICRLNVGGQYIPPTKDSGLTRTWYDDSPFLFGGLGVTAEILPKHVPKYAPDYPLAIAPPDVYSSARALGLDGNVSKSSNLTWVFQVDANFTYVVRLHFCELVFDKPNQRLFDVFINNNQADELDPLLVVTSPETPFYKDYAIYVNDLPGDENMTISVRPTINDQAASEYYNVLLNGLEILKLNDTTGNLAGPNPVPSDYMLLVEKHQEEEQMEKDKIQEEKDRKRQKVVGGAAGGAAAFGLVAAMCIAVYQRQKRVHGNDPGASGWLPLYGSWTNSKSSTGGKSTGSSTLSSLAQGLCRHFSLSEMKSGTKNFDESNVIGVGGFGKVYKGIVDGSTKVAIKRANPSSEQGLHEFRTEIEMLSKLRHRHLVSLIGFCEEDEEMILVYDYMGNGTLREHLYKTNKPHLSWKQRLEICIGSARGLYYLHTGAKYTIIHRDVKTTNILLDDNWVAKVSDFGLSKTGPALNQTHVSTVVKGSFGYLDPEYFRRQQLTDKSDVYSFGVVLFEVLCARPALNPSLPKEQVSLADWALHCIRKGTLEDIIDPDLKGKINQECLKKFVDTAEKCLSDQGMLRPSMGDVLWNLEFALQLHENPNGASLIADERTKSSDPGHGPDVHFGVLNSPLDDSDNSNAAFSQLINPQGR